MNLFGPRNSIILLKDPTTRESLDALEDLIKEVRKYYRFETISRMARPEKKTRALGHACLVLKEPRKFFFHSLFPFLYEEKIPFTLLLRADEIGTNRLSIDEECKVYEEVFPSKLEDIRQIANEAKSTEDFRNILRQRLGSFPFEKLDPLRFYMTWGQVNEVIREQADIGLSLSSFLTEDGLQEAKGFAEKQTKKTVSVLWSSVPLSFTTDLPILSPHSGLVEKRTPLALLPVWKSE